MIFLTIRFVHIIYICHVKIHTRIEMKLIYRFLMIIAFISLSYTNTQATPIYKCNNTQGFWVKGDQNIWYEILPNGSTHTYIQATVDGKYIYLYDEYREIGIALPKKSGECFLTAQGKNGAWSEGSSINIEESYIQFIDEGEENNMLGKKSGAITADVETEEDSLDSIMNIDDSSAENFAGK